MGAKRIPSQIQISRDPKMTPSAFAGIPPEVEGIERMCYPGIRILRGILVIMKSAGDRLFSHIVS